MADLPTNYLDDILAVSMGGKRKFKITHENGSTEEVTIEDISDYDQVGSVFGAGDINRTNQAVNEKFDSGDVVDPMLTTEEGFAADAYKTKLQFDEQNKNINNLIKSTTVTATTDNGGRAIGLLDITNKIVVSCETNDGYIVQNMTSRYNNKYNVHIMNYDFTNVINTTIEFIIYYIEIKNNTL